MKKTDLKSRRIKIPEYISIPPSWSLFKNNWCWAKVEKHFKDSLLKTIRLLPNGNHHIHQFVRGNCSKHVVTNCSQGQDTWSRPGSITQPKSGITRKTYSGLAHIRLWIQEAMTLLAGNLLKPLQPKWVTTTPIGYRNLERKMYFTTVGFQV